jgi:hypothetical protein
MISASSWLLKKKSIAMHGNMNVKFTITTFMQMFYSGTRDFFTPNHYIPLKYISLRIVTGITSQ